MARDIWHDEAEVQEDVDALVNHVKLLTDKYGDRIEFYADDPFCSWKSICVALERERECNVPTPSLPYQGKIVRRSYHVEL